MDIFVENGFVESGFIEGVGGGSTVEVEFEIKTLIYPINSINELNNDKIVKITKDIDNKEKENVKYFAYVISPKNSYIIPSTFLKSKRLKTLQISTTDEQEVKRISSECLTEKLPKAINKLKDRLKDEIKSDSLEIINKNINELSPNQLAIIANKVIEVMKLNEVKNINYSPTIANVKLYDANGVINLPLESRNGAMTGEVSINGGRFVIEIKDR